MSGKTGRFETRSAAVLAESAEGLPAVQFADTVVKAAGPGTVAADPAQETPSPAAAAAAPALEESAVVGQETQYTASVAELLHSQSVGEQIHLFVAAAEAVVALHTEIDHTEVAQVVRCCHHLSMNSSLKTLW